MTNMLLSVCRGQTTCGRLEGTGSESAGQAAVAAAR